MPQLCPSRTCRRSSALAAGAVEGRALALAQLADGRAAAAAGLARPPIDEVLLLEAARVAVALYVIAQAAAAGGERLVERLAHGGREAAIALERDAPRRRCGMDEIGRASCRERV